MKVKQSTCNYCSLACNLDFYVDDNKIKKILPTKGYPVNDGFCCIKGLNLSRQCTKFKTRGMPLIRDKKGKIHFVSWKDAFETFAIKMNSIQKKYGKQSAAYLSTGQITTEEMALLGFIGRMYMGISGDGNTRLCMSTSAVAYKQSFGFDAPPYTLKDLEISDTIVLVGANPVVAHPIAWSRIRENKTAKIITIDPRKSETAVNSDWWIGIKPKSDIVFLYTLANVLINKNWIDRDYIVNCSENFEMFKEHVKKYSLEYAEGKTGISGKDIIKLAGLIHKGEKVSFWWTMGVNQGWQAVRTAQAIIDLAVITGNMGREGTGANSLSGQCNAMGSRLYSNTTALYGGRDFDNPVHRKEISSILDVDEKMIPEKPTIPYNEIINRINGGDIKALWVIGTNPAHSWANNGEFKRAVKNLELLVVQDIYADTDTSKLCDLFLPSVPALKKEGSFINTERRISAVVPVLKKEKGELTDYDILLGIGRAFKIGKSLEKWKTPRHAFELIKEFSRGMPCDITGVDYKKLIFSRGIQWPFREGDKLDDERRLFEDNRYFTPNGKVKLIYEEPVKNPAAAGEDFPYILNSGRGTVGQWHTQTRTREIEFVKDSSMASAYIFMNFKLAERLGLKRNEYAIISSINGCKSKFKVIPTDNIGENQLFAPIHYIETNFLTPSVFDRYSREPSYKCTAVNVKKIQNSRR
ncbi:molybdopterin oxidoreductase family protein [uncultured Clostridium sp.]|uniref:molybdopterin oxidoreductase family protein n=1 Tax=uncultured Clostridium sp. TaxID=59620 RepID=UPI0025CDEA68|nr:molybdopterin oxidoreductase family protein [uncultured Clostridium sp.]